jgi:hypothetical protein
VGGWVCVSPLRTQVDQHNIARHVDGKDVVIGEVWPVIKSAITHCDSNFFCSEAVTLLMLSVNVVVFMT